MTSIGAVLYNIIALYAYLKMFANSIMYISLFTVLCFSFRTNYIYISLFLLSGTQG